MGHGAELAIVLPHLLPGHLGLTHYHLHVTVTQGGHHHHGAGLASYTVKVHRLTISHFVDVDGVQSESIYCISLIYF